MNNNLFIREYQFQLVRTSNNQSIPEISGVQLGSKFDPQKEAQNQLKSYQKIFQEKNNFLCFGCGNIYFLQAIEATLNLKSQPSHLWVIDPMLEMENYIQPDSNFSNSKHHFNFFFGKSAEEIYTDDSFLDFICNSPALIIHRATYDYFKDYFNSVMSFSHPQNVGSWGTVKGHHNLKNDIAIYPAEFNMNEILNQIDAKFNMKQHTQADFLLLALREIHQNIKKNNTGENLIPGVGVNGHE